MATKLEKLLEQKAKLDERLKDELSKNKNRERKLDTRRKVLLGALCQARMEKDAAFKADIEKALPSFLTRRTDREVFGLSGGDDGPGASKSDDKKIAAA